VRTGAPLAEFVPSTATWRPPRNRSISAWEKRLGMLAATYRAGVRLSIVGRANLDYMWVVASL